MKKEGEGRRETIERSYSVDSICFKGEVGMFACDGASCIRDLVY